MRRLIAFLGVGLVILVGLNVLSLAAPGAERQVYRGLMAHADSVETITVGSSISAAIDFDTLGVQGWHVWLPSSDLLENEALVRAALPRLPRLKRVLVAIPPVAFQWLNPARGAPQYRRQAYRAMGPDLAMGAIDGDWANLAIAWALPLVRDDAWREPVALALSRLGAPADPPSALMAKNGAWLPLAGSATALQRQHLAIKSAPGVFQGVLATLSADPDAPRRLEAAAPRLARLLAARGVSVVFYTPPIAPEYEQAFDSARPPQIQDARQTMARLARDNGLIYVDLSRDPVLSGQADRLFYDPLHLNQVGARRFSQRLRTELERRGAPGFSAAIAR